MIVRAIALLLAFAASASLAPAQAQEATRSVPASAQRERSGVTSVRPSVRRERPDAPASERDDAEDAEEAEHRAGVTLVNPSARRDRPSGVTVASGFRRAAPVAADRGEGEVLLNVRSADLASEVLPSIEEQVGIRIRYSGVPRAVSLRLVRPVHWEAAVELICRFTNTHLATDYQGRFLLKPRHGGQLPARGTFDDLDGQVATPERILAVRASARRPSETLDLERPTLPKIQLGSPRGYFPSGPLRGRVGPRRVGPRRVGPRRVGPRRQARPRRTGPRRVGPRRTGPRQRLRGR